MKKQSKVLCILFFFLSMGFIFSSCSQKPSPQKTPPLRLDKKSQKTDQSATQNVLKGDQKLTGVFGFNVGESRYIFHKNGIGEKIFPDGSKKVFRLPIDSYDTIQRVDFFIHENSLGILYDFTDGASGAATLIYLNQNTLEQKWVLELPTYHTGESLLSFPNYYITAMGFIGKVDLKTGKLLWKHDELYRPEKGGIELFGTPERNGDLIEFSKKETSEPYLIQVDDQTGKIIEIIK